MQQLYFVKEIYEIFSTQISAKKNRRQNNAGSHQVVIVSLLISSVKRPFSICLAVCCSCRFVVRFLLSQSTCEVSLRKRFQKPPENAEALEIVTECRSANDSWRPNLKATQNEVKKVKKCLKR